MTQRVEVFFSIWREELNLSCFPIWLKELNLFFFQNAQGIEPLFRMNYFLHDSNWTLLWSIRLKEQNFSHKWLKVLNTFFWIWLKELNLFCIGLKELNFCFYLTQRIEFLSFCQKTTTQRIELFSKTRYKELNFFQYDSKNFWIWLEELNPFFKF